MSQSDQGLLRAVTAALNANPFADPIHVGTATLSRAAARAAERRLSAVAAAERRAA